ncbi:uncharacterized protein LOC131032301 isoform X1 [Cryptomeria japonica]|uniref:uncharacterized protein LOC131032301 isoform X1 n=3 Tax=Cryptomeria japonica TaxID=3369 RepID=UPI0027D9D78C|nr:uncharacterized protein LOC131032301 isoform X1 [Cryptomeria japonica]XP_057819220.2 uncharacterized protein LOC131032301 isoform X1 [Cryptomeria japonica]XP_057819221.2 uncharacterized protein LOC131032301 isoform X1 [Cryptomeria japonica]XP_057819222.2 uncharacterized protein LOC131032301 isoform X1 [Cryptomeria japonica]
MDDVIIGLLAAFGSALFFGSYAVPIKMPAALSLDPFVFQSYKSTACFMTSWLVLLYTPYRFTWWGMLGALIWVTNGVMAISAVRWAGIGIAQSLWSGLSIFIAYIWGAYVFKEHLKSHFLSLLALLIMTLGMIGIGIAVSGVKGLPSLLDVWLKLEVNFVSKKDCPKYNCIKVEDSSQPFIKGMTPDAGRVKGDCDHQSNNLVKGILCAVLVGAMNGSFMIPLKYANKDVVGVEYLVSFGIGSMTMTLVLLGTYTIVLVFQGRPLPSLYVPGAVGPAFLAGLLWSLGNFFSIYATLDLGVALGWPLVQCQLLVSAMWAVFFYKEVTTKTGAALLLGSSILVVSGAIMLSIFGTTG